MMERLLMHIGLIDQVTRPLQSITSQMQSTIDAGREGMGNMAAGGAGLVASGLAIQSALMPAIEMDRKMGEVASLGVTSDGLKELQKTALTFSIEYGKSATNFVEASYDIQSAIAGLDGHELSQFTKASGILAAATKADTSTITDYMGTMYGIFKNQATEMGKGEWVEEVAGMTASAVQMFKTTGFEMSSAFTSVGADATSVGVGMNEQMAILGTLQATMSGSEAGTKYRAFLGGVAKAQDKLNLSFTNSHGQLLPIIDILDKLKGRYGDTIDVAESAELAKAFGTKEATGMIKLLMADTDGLSQSIEQLGQIQGMGKAEEMAAKMTDQWERLEAAWFAVRASAFGIILPSINAVVGTMADGLSVITQWVDEFPLLGKILGFVTIGALALGGVVAGLSLAMGIGQIMSAGWGVTVGILSGVFRTLRISTLLMTASTWLFSAALWANPITWVVAGIAGLIVAIGAAIYYWDEIKASFMDTAVFRFLADTIDWVIDKLNMIPGIDIDVNADMPSTPELEAAIKLSPLASTAQLGATQVDTSQLDASQLGAAQLDASQLGVVQLDASQLGVAQLDASQLGVAQLDASQLGLVQLDASQLGATQLDTSQLDNSWAVAAQIEDHKVNAWADNQSDDHAMNGTGMFSYKEPQNQTPLPSNMVQNATSINQHKAGNSRTVGTININTKERFTPDMLDQIEALSAG